MEALSYGPFITRKQAQEQGLRHYYTGNICKHGHCAPYSANTCQCLTCRKAKSAEAYEQRKADPAKLETYRERARLRAEEQRRTNPELVKARKEASRTKRLADDDFISWGDRNKERKLELQRDWNARKRAEGDAQYRLRRRLSDRVRIEIKRSGSSKNAQTLELLGCTIEEVRDYLELQFLPGMTWDNWTKDGWHVDHIRPCASFDLTDPEQQKECFHFSNLQPLWAEDNLRKSDKWEPATMEA